MRTYSDHPVARTGVVMTSFFLCCSFAYALDNIIEKELMRSELSISAHPTKPYRTECSKPITTRCLQRAPESQKIMAFAIKESSWEGGGNSHMLLPECADNRIRVENSDKWPNSVHGFVHCKENGNSSYYGTGIMVTPYLVLTAARNLWDTDTKKEAKKVTFIPARNGDTRPFNTIKVQHFYIPEEYKNNNKSEEDYAILVLKQPVGERTGYFGLAFLCDKKLLTKTLCIIGYPADKNPTQGTHFLWKGTGQATACNRDSVRYQISTSQGQSGSGVWYQETQDEYYVVGVHVCKKPSDSEAVRLTGDRYQRIRNWIRDYAEKEINKATSYKNVRECDLSSRSIEVEGVRKLAFCPLPFLRILNLRSNSIGDAGATVLV